MDDSMPGDLDLLSDDDIARHEEQARRLMENIEGFCRGSMLPFTSIIGALEGVKAAMLHTKLAEFLAERED